MLEVEEDGVAIDDAVVVRAGVAVRVSREGPGSRSDAAICWTSSTSAGVHSNSGSSNAPGTPAISARRRSLAMPLSGARPNLARSASRSSSRPAVRECIRPNDPAKASRAASALPASSPSRASARLSPSPRSSMTSTPSRSRRRRDEAKSWGRPSPPSRGRGSRRGRPDRSRGLAPCAPAGIGGPVVTAFDWPPDLLTIADGARRRLHRRQRNTAVLPSMAPLSRTRTPDSNAPQHALDGADLVARERGRLVRHDRSVAEAFRAPR